MASSVPPLNEGVENLQNVVKLSEYRRRKMAAPRQVARQDSSAIYYCLRCDGDEFKLQAVGGVTCASCGALMRNLLVQTSGAEEIPQ
jgi:hypothetical protein